MDKAQQKSTNAKMTRQHLVDAALSLFLQNGYEGTGINQILTSAKLSKGAFYHHFSCKHEIYEETVSDFFLEPLEELDTEQMSGMPLKTMRKILSEHYANLPKRTKTANIDMSRYLACFFEALSRLPAFRAKIDAHYSALINMLADRTYEEREIFPKVANAHARNIVGALEGQLMLEVLSSKPSSKS